jgi:hypothetical protein
LAEAMYAKASQQQGPEQQTSQETDHQAASGDKTKKEDVVDADFEEVKE